MVSTAAGRPGVALQRLVKKRRGLSYELDAIQIKNRSKFFFCEPD
jgi:hypothetical protein